MSVPSKSVISGPLRVSNLFRKILYYICVMLAFRTVSRDIIEKDKLYEKLAGVPPMVIDSLVVRFTETPRGTTTYEIIDCSCFVLNVSCLL